MDILVTTPKSQMKKAAEEAAEVIKNGDGYYYHWISKLPNKFKMGVPLEESRIFYVEDGYIRGFGIIKTINYRFDEFNQKGKYLIWWNATTWQWIKPIPYKGFQGFRYFTPPDNMEILGDWLQPKPLIGVSENVPG